MRSTFQTAQFVDVGEREFVGVGECSFLNVADISFVIDNEYQDENDQ